MQWGGKEDACEETKVDEEEYDWWDFWLALFCPYLYFLTSIIFLVQITNEATTISNDQEEDDKCIRR